MLQRMIAESVQLGSGLSGSKRVVVDRTRVLAEHGVKRAEEARQLDAFVLRVGGSLRRVRGTGGGFVWDLPRAALEGTLEQRAEVQSPRSRHPGADSQAASG
jgi:hypothetical protein